MSNMDRHFLDATLERIVRSKKDDFIKGDKFEVLVSSDFTWLRFCVHKDDVVVADVILEKPEARYLVDTLVLTVDQMVDPQDDADGKIGTLNGEGE